MEKNMGTVDRVVRVVLALVFAYLGYVYSYWFFLLTLILLVTAGTGFCLPYKWLGFSTVCKKCAGKKKK